MLNAVNNSVAVSNAALAAALEAGHSLQLQNLQSVANQQQIASQWSEISKVVDSLGNITTTLQRNVVGISPAAAITPSFAPSQQQVTIVNGAPTSQTTINQPAQSSQLPLEKPKSLCETNPDVLACDSNGDVAEAPLTTKDINVSVVPYALPSNYVCPAPIHTVGVGGVMHTFDLWRQPCQVAMGMHPLVLAFAWLAAAGILVRRI